MVEKDFASGYTVTVIGCGVMGKAVISSILDKKFDPYPAKIICCNSSKCSAEETKAKFSSQLIETSYGIESNRRAVQQADVIILGVKPYMLKDVDEQYRSSLSGQQLVISLLAGVTLGELECLSNCVVKVMTNTAAQFGCGMAGVAFSSSAKEKHYDLVMKMIKPVGRAVELPEKNMDAATALIGSGIGFGFLVLEALIEGGVRVGMPYSIAQESAAKTMEGAARMVLETGEVPALLKSKVCTPGGTTIGGLLKLEDAGVRGAISRAVEEAANISASFGRKK